MSDSDSQPAEPLVEPLTRREREILTYLSEGFSAPEIAEQLTLAVSSVKFHIQNVYGKLGAKSKRQALTRAAELGLLEAPPASAAPSPAQPMPKAKTAAEARNNLPVQLTNFIGREQQIAEARRVLRTTHLLTLTGPGGTGKTRLALQIAAESLGDFADGAWLVELAPIADGAQVPQAIAQALPVKPESAGDSEAAGRAGNNVLTLIIEHLRDKRLLLVLDNCEHIVAAAAVLAERLLRAAPELRILATSREALGVIGENSLPVPALSVPAPGQLPPLEALGQSEAVQLFVERARAVRPDFALTAENAAAVVQVCRRLDGIPLAIELAAARIRALMAEQIAAHLDDRFRLLTGGSRTAPPRQQTLRGAIDWSYELLTDAERALLRRLSVFAGGSTVEAGEHMLSTPDALDLLAQLVAKSLVLSIQQPGQEARFTLLETIRDYAYDRLVEAGEAESARGRHMAHFLALAEEAEPALRGKDQVKWLFRLDREIDNLRAALTHAVKQTDAESALRLAGALINFWDIRNNEAEGRRWLEAALDLHARRGIPGPSAWQAKALFGAGFLERWNQDMSASLSRLEKAVDIYAALGDRAGIAYGQYLLGDYFRWPQVDLPRALSHFETALDLYTAAEDGWGIGVCLNNLGRVAEAMGERAKAAELYQRSVEILREVGDRWQQLLPLNSLGRLLWAQGNIASGKSLLGESQAISAEFGGKFSAYAGLNSMASLLTEQGLYAEAIEVIRKMEQDSGSAKATAEARLGEVAYVQGHMDEATRRYETAYVDFGADNDVHGQAWPLARMGCMAYRLGDLDRSARLLEQSLDHLVPTGWYWNRALVLLVQGDIARVRGQYAAAGELYTQSLKLLVGEPRDLPDRVEAFAKLAAADQQPQRAARLFGAASAMRERLSVPIPPVERADYEAALEQARAQLDPAEFSAAWAEGAALSAEQAVMLALDEGADPKGY